MAEFFGFEFKRKTQVDNSVESFAPPNDDDGAVIVTPTPAGFGAYSTVLDLDGVVRNEADLITKYREISMQPEVDSAIDEIVNEAITLDEDQDVVDIVLDDVQIPDKVKLVLSEEFKDILKKLEFFNHPYDVFRRWYIDGRLYYHVIVKDPAEGIAELRYLDPRKIRKVREIQRVPLKVGQAGEASMNKVINEYYIYNEKGFSTKNTSPGLGTQPGVTQGLKIARDSIVMISSGLTDANGTLVMSYLQKCIRECNQLRTLENAAIIYRLSRAPERRLWYIDVGNLPKMKAEQYVKEIMTKYKNKLVYDSQTGEIRDDRKYMCYALDTKIPLLDGRTLTIEEIISEYESGKTNWVYSCDPKTGKFVPGPVSWAGITKHNSSAVRVTLDNGKSVVCTPDHKFPVWNREGFTEAQHLKAGDSLIPGYRRHKPVMPGGRDYEQIYKNDTKTWEFTHREVAKWKDELDLREETAYNVDHVFSEKNTIHHRDFNALNNSPDNLIMMNAHDHLEYHRDIQSIRYTEEIFDIVEECAKELLEVNASVNKINGSINLTEWRELNRDRNPKNRDTSSLVFTAKDLNRISKMIGFSTWRKYRDHFDDRVRENNGRLKRGECVKYSDEWRSKLSIAAKKRKPKCKTWKVFTPAGQEEIVENLNEYCRNNGLNRSNIKRDYGSKGYRAEQLHNHKVVSVEWLPEKITVAALTIDQDETYHSHHTYLLDIGVYTKNTMLEDFWLPRREGGRGTQVDTLKGGQNLGEMDDVLYFQKQLYRALNVPVTRLDSEAMFDIGRATQISRDEIKFAKFIDRLRTRFTKLFLDLMEKQILLKQIATYDDWVQMRDDIKFRFARDNYFAELKEAEILSNRYQLLESVYPFIGKVISWRSVRKQILRQDDEEIAVEDAQIAQELLNPQYNSALLDPDQNGMGESPDLPPMPEEGSK